MTSKDINTKTLKMASKLLQALKDFVTYLSLVGPFFKEIFARSEISGIFSIEVDP